MKPPEKKYLDEDKTIFTNGGLYVYHNCSWCKGSGKHRRITKWLKKTIIENCSNCHGSGSFPFAYVD